MRDLSKHLRGGDFRHAVKAIGSCGTSTPPPAGLSFPRSIRSTNNAPSSFSLHGWWWKAACVDWRRAGERPDKYIELLGLSAGSADQHAIALLEGFRPIAGETRRYETETLDPENLPWSTRVVAERKGIAPGTHFKRVWSKPTGLLDLKGLEKAIERIRRRAK